MRALIKALAVIVLATLVPASAAIAQEVYNNPAFGFTITKPAAWHYLSTDQYKENLSSLNDARLKELAARYAKTPFFAITKYNQATHDDINPSIQVKVREAGALKALPPVETMKVVAKVASSMFKEAAIDEGPAETTIGGKPAAYMRINFVAELRGLQRPATSELWIVPKGDMLLIISSSTLRDESNGTRAEIRKILDTIKLQ